MTHSSRSGRRQKLPPASYRDRRYRQCVRAAGLVAFQVVCEQTDLMIQADVPLADPARERVLHYRAHLEGYIEQHSEFAASMVPWPASTPAPLIVRRMIDAGQAAGVGPMAAVAGAMAECVGRDLLAFSRQVIVENGGDLFLKTAAPIVTGIFAGASPLSMKIGLRIDDVQDGMGVCTSSGTVGHSLSQGTADAVCVVSRSCALADAAATTIGNRVSCADDIQPAICFGRGIDGVLGMVIVIGEKLGVWGAVELVPLAGKKG